MAQLIPLNLPIRMQCLRVPVEWQCKRSGTRLENAHGDDRDYYSFRAYVTTGEHSFFDPWEMRAEFFRLRDQSELDGLLKFLNKVGLFDKADAGDVGRAPDVAEEYLIKHKNWRFWVRDQPEVEYMHFFSMQGVMRQAMTSKGSHVLDNSDFEFRFVRDRREGYLLLTTVSFLHAVAATIQIDRLRKAKIHKCARPDCAIPFAVTGERARKYCSWYCGHLESVRNKRKLEKSATHIRKKR